MDEVKNKILNGAIQLYMRYGIKSLTMDDIARELGISKKTLYHYVTDKDDLVSQAMLSYLNNEEMQCMQVFSTPSNPISEMLELIKWQFKTHSQLNQSALYDLKKYHPGSFSHFLAFKNTIIKPRVSTNLERGIKLELYRSDLNIEITTQVYLHLIDFNFNHEVTVVGNVGRLIYELIKYHLFSVTSSKGRKVLAKELEKFNTELQQII